MLKYLLQHFQKNKKKVFQILVFSGESPAWESEFDELDEFAELSEYEFRGALS
jgi:hypothetical protein